jgi:two-component system, cell cycle response regulator DivK
VSPSTPHTDANAPLVLVVDDTETNLKLARDVLRANGLRTVEAASGAQALELAASVQPDVILLDLQLPDMDGIEVVRELRARTSTSPIPVVALTALRIGEDDGWLRAAGFSACIEKPIDTRDFAARVRSYAEGRTS